MTHDKFTQLLGLAISQGNRVVFFDIEQAEILYRFAELIVSECTVSVLEYDDSFGDDVSLGTLQDIATQITEHFNEEQTNDSW